MTINHTYIVNNGQAAWIGEKKKLEEDVKKLKDWKSQRLESEKKFKERRR